MEIVLVQRAVESICISGDGEKLMRNAIICTLDHILLVSLKQGGQCKYNICIEQRKN
jgi:hypothetical protein